MRDLSVFARGAGAVQRDLSAILRGFSNGPARRFLGATGHALFAGVIIIYAQGLALLSVASDQYGYHFDIEAVARLWRGGCIIRAALLEDICTAFHARRDLPNLLLDPNCRARLWCTNKIYDTWFARRPSWGIARDGVYEFRWVIWTLIAAPGGW